MDYLVHQASSKLGICKAAFGILEQAANTLNDLGYKKLRAKNLKRRHVDALVKHWKGQELTPGTVKNRMAQLRWWAEKVGHPRVIARNNDHYDIERRAYVTGEDKSRALDDRLDKVTDHHVKMSLRLQAAFGLRREEAIKFNPSYADQADHLQLKGSWTKGGKPQVIPVLTPEQRQLLDEARRFAGFGAMIPSNKNYIQQLRTYERNTSKAGLDKMHGLRHAYAQSRYEDLTGWKCPIQGGPERRELLSKVVFQRLNQATIWSTSFTSIPSLNAIPVITAYSGESDHPFRLIPIT